MGIAKALNHDLTQFTIEQAKAYLSQTLTIHYKNQDVTSLTEACWKVKDTFMKRKEA